MQTFARPVTSTLGYFGTSHESNNALHVGRRWSPSSTHINPVDVQQQIMSKNKMIHSLASKVRYLQAELLLLKQSTNSSDTNAHDDYISSKMDSVDTEKRMVLETILAYKKQLEKFKETITTTLDSLSRCETEKKSLQDSLSSLQQTIASTSTSDMHTKYTESLEQTLEKYRLDNAQLQNMLGLWTLTAKQNDDARVQAESCVSYLESQVETLKQSILEYQHRSTMEFEQSNVSVNDTIDEKVREMSMRIDELEMQLQLSTDNTKRQQKSNQEQVSQLVETISQLESFKLEYNENQQVMESAFADMKREYELEIRNLKLQHESELKTYRDGYAKSIVKCRFPTSQAETGCSSFNSCD